MSYCDFCGASLSNLPDTPTEERRLVSALFCDLVGFTPLAELLDPEDLRDIQAEYFSAMDACISRYGGIVEKYAGDAVLALFGAPVTHEDDAERAVLCALAMQQAIEPLAERVRHQDNAEVAIRVGVNTGEVVSGSWAVSGQQQAAISGDTVNTAARLQAAVRAGGVLVGEETMRLARRRIRFGNGQRLTLKGKAEPVAAYAALGVREQIGERWEGVERGSAAIPFIGRERELETILAAWRRAQHGEGQLLTLVGEAGVGKSRLLAAAVEHITARARVAAHGSPHLVRGRCLSYGQSVSLWLIADLLRSISSVREDATREVVVTQIASTVDDGLASCDETDRAIAKDVLGEVLGSAGGASLVAGAGPQVRRQALIRMLGLLFGSLAQDDSLVLLLEDLHWLDSASQEIMSEVLLSVQGLPVLVIATTRPGWIAPWNSWSWTDRLVLHPLPDADAALLAGEVLGGMPLSGELESHIRERAGGNPFYVEELLHFLQVSGGLEEQRGTVSLIPGIAEKLPSTLTEVLLARLDRLEQQVKGVAQIGSVIGRSFAVRLLSRIVDRDERALAAPLRTLQESEITYSRIEGELEHVFKHALLRDAAYGMLVQRRKRQLHLRVGRAMATLYPGDEHVEMIAFHLARTEEDAEAALWLERAGDRARDSYAIEAAIAHYQTAAERLERCGGSSTSIAAIELKMGWILNRSVRYREAQLVLERAVARYRQAGDLEGAAEAIAELGSTLAEMGELDETQQLLEGILALLAERGVVGAATRLEIALAGICQYQGRYTDMLAATERASEVARVVGDVKALGLAEERRGSALIHLGRIEEGRVALEAAMRMLEDAGAFIGLHGAVRSLGENRRVSGDLTEAARLNERALDLTNRTGNVVGAMFINLNLAQIRTATGEWARAAEHIAKAEAAGHASGDYANVVSYFLTARGELALRAGKWQAARLQLDRAAEMAMASNYEVLEVVQTLLAELEILAGQAAHAKIRLTGMIGKEGTHLPLLLATMAWAEVETGEPARGLELAEQAERESRERRMLLYLPDALRVKGMALTQLGRTNEASRVLTEARERASAMPNPYTEARIIEQLALIARQEGKAHQVETGFQDALAIFQRLGAKKDLERAVQALRSLNTV